MLALCQEIDELTEFSEDAGIPLNVHSNEVDEEQPQLRQDKIFTIRRQLAEGTYDLDGLLDAVIDQLLAVICV